ncbi:hypothetical protein OHAE_4132 [Ochrobactrum soli]|uniref:Uncharacterized protein n=1 Tax=Ochrobactrum soli TaxID=2448455 RepID=A0A2P9HBX0_9HYPH|nr:hypothetical protein OHAE_4132 [[Ochrobactrum] soli]
MKLTCHILFFNHCFAEVTAFGLSNFFGTARFQRSYNDLERRFSLDRLFLV